MNIQALMKQAQSMQKEMMSIKEELDKKEFTIENSLVRIVVLGNKKVKNIEILTDDKLDKDDVEMLQDMIIVALNEAFSKIDAEYESKMGKFSSMAPGLF